MPWTNLDDRKAYFRKRYREDPEFKRKHLERSQAHYAANKKQHAIAGRKRNRAIKIEAILRYGGECFCCGELQILFLAIDHKNGGGNQQRKSLKLYGGVQFYRWLKRRGWPDGYQVSCHNCNIGRHLNGGVCPHKT